MHYFEFLFTEVQNVSDLFWMLLVFDFFLVILETLYIYCYLQ